MSIDLSLYIVAAVGVSIGILAGTLFCQFFDYETDYRMIVGLSIVGVLGFLIFGGVNFI